MINRLMKIVGILLRLNALILPYQPHLSESSML